MKRLARPILCLLLPLALQLGGCAGVETIRGELNYDLRPADQRQDVFWPSPPNPPRYRYVGELVGQPNFIRESGGLKDTAMTALKWLAGIFDRVSEVRLVRPQHGTVAEDGRIYVVDAGRNAVVVFDPQAPLEEAEGDAGGGGQMLVWQSFGEEQRFAAPISVAMVWDGLIAVSDAKLGVVFVLDRQGKLVTQLGLGQLQRPTGLAFDRLQGRLYVADTPAHAIRVFDRSGAIVQTLGTPAEGEAQFNAPTQLAFAQERLYVSDTLNSRVQMFDRSGRRVNAFGERGLYVGNLARPKGVAADNGIVYVIESYYAHLLAYSDKGEFLLGINGSGLKGGEFFLPSGVWCDDQGRVFVADMFNARVVVYQFLGDHEL
jgi:DNA-binding beta-propeller fold protein YncE